jgi:hypothetical protein
MSTQIANDIGLAAEFERFPVLELLFQELADPNLNTQRNKRAAGVEILFLNEVNGSPNRARLLICFPVVSKCVLFFYKKSSIPFSRDRFSYGGVVIDERSTSRFSEQDIQQWIEFLLSGFEPQRRPETLKKSLPYTIPEEEE